MIGRGVTWLRRLLTGLALLYGAIMNTFLIANLIKPTLPTVAILNQLAPWITLGSFLVFALAFTLRAPLQTVLWLLPGAVAFVYWFAPAWLPKPIPKADGITITVATHNILGGLADMDRIVDVIHTMDADIIALQEVYGNRDELLQARLAELYPSHVAHVVRENGLVLLSRYPIISSEAAVVDGRDGRHMRIEVDVNGQHVIVYLIHPPSPAWAPGMEHLYDMLFEYDESRTQPHIDNVIDRIQAETLPVLLLCDCNSTPRSRQYHALDAVLNEAFGARGWGLGFTHPAEPFPALRIDYVWYDDHFAALEAKVWPDAGTSDHHPVWARLVLKADQTE